MNPAPPLLSALIRASSALSTATVIARGFNASGHRHAPEALRLAGVCAEHAAAVVLGDDPEGSVACAERVAAQAVALLATTP